MYTAPAGNLIYPLFISFGPMAATLANFYYGLADPSETFGIKHVQAYGQ